MPEPDYPPVGFYFRVDLTGVNPSSSEIQSSFQEVGGLSSEFEIESVTEGGENRFAHRLPGKAKYPNLVLKRGLLKENGRFAKWCLNTMQLGQADPIEPKNVAVSLLNEKGVPSMSWLFYNAWPVKMQLSDLITSEDMLAVETIELSYQYFETKSHKSDLGS